MGDFSGPMRSSPAPARMTAAREDCWTEEATATLIDAWGKRYVELNRGNLRQKDWQDVARAVNLRHGHCEKQRRTDIQCKNRIDTIKKKYKVEKVKDVSSWRFFQQLDELIGPKQGEMVSKKMGAGGSGMSGFGRAEGVPRGTRSGLGGGFGTGIGSPPLAIVLRKEPSELPEAVAVTPLRRSGGMDDSYFRRNYSAMAAAAAKEEVFEDDEDEEGTEEEGSEEPGEGMREDTRGKQVLMDVDVNEMGGEKGGMDGAKMIAMAIEKFAATYDKVETEKLRQFKLIEQRRIDAIRDVELERTRLLMNTQVEMEKRMRKNAKKKSSGLDDICSS